MHRYDGQLRYSTNNSGRAGQTLNVSLSVSFSPGSFTVVVEDTNAQTTHRLSNRRFNFQSRDSPVDLLARAKWRSERYGRFVGDVILQCPRITGVPRELRITLISSWDPAFAVVEFRLGDTYYQMSRRPPRGVSLWERVTFPWIHDTYESPATVPAMNVETVPSQEPASSSTDPPDSAPPP